MTSEFVLDASIAFAWVYPGQATPASENLLKLVESGTVAVVPPLWFLEVSNGLLVAQHRKLISPAQRREALDGLSALALVANDADPRSAFGRTTTLAEQHGLSVYDAAYLEVALRRSIPLGSRDRALLVVARQCGVAVVP